LSLTLLNGLSRISCRAIVDSGADHCVFPRLFMQPLGIDPFTSPVEGTAGVGSTNVPTHFSNITIDLQGVVRLPVYAGFTTGLDHLGIGLLGQAGFFEAFKITFDYANKLYHLETR
jgi:aspartyl protease